MKHTSDWLAAKQTIQKYIYKLFEPMADMLKVIFLHYFYSLSKLDYLTPHLR